MLGEDGEVDAGAVSRGCDDAADSLVGDRTDIDHGKLVGGEGGMESVEGDAGLRYNVVGLLPATNLPKTNIEGNPTQSSALCACNFEI